MSTSAEMAIEAATKPTPEKGADAGAAPHAGGFLRNFAWTAVGFAVSMASTILLTPFLVRRLGIETYGVVALVMNSTVYVTILTNVINPVAGRYFVGSRQANAPYRPTQVFSTILLANLAICAIAVLAACALTSQIGRALGVPDGASGFGPLLWLAIAAMALTQLGTAYGIIAYAGNRLDVQSKAGIWSAVLRLAGVVVLFALLSPRVEYVGVAMLVAAGVGMVVCRRYVAQVDLGLRVSRGEFSWDLTRRMARESLWVMIAQLGTMLFMRIDVILAGQFYGIGAAGQYGAVVAMVLPLLSVGGMLGGLFGPQTTHLAVKQDYGQLLVYMRQSTKFVGFALAVPSAILCAHPELFVRKWTGLAEVPPALAWSLVLLVCHICVTYGVIPLMFMQVTCNRMRLPSVMTWAMAGLNLTLSYVFISQTSLGLVSLPLSIAICLLIKNVLVTPVHCAIVLGKPWMSLFGPVMAITVLLVAGIGGQMAMRPWMDGWNDMMQMMMSLATAAVVSGCVVPFLLNGSEREQVRSVLQKARARFAGRISA